MERRRLKLPLLNYKRQLTRGQLRVAHCECFLECSASERVVPCRYGCVVNSKSRVTTTNQQQRVVLATGASSGIGKVIARQLIQDGLKVVVAARSVDKMADLKSLGAHVISLDISREESIAAAVAEIEKSCGGVDSSLIMPVLASMVQSRTCRLRMPVTSLR
jgi:D-arabinose 1-dehydrogenase-like Zn-dependent alcohol dehydrogenase